MINWPEILKLVPGMPPLGAPIVPPAGPVTALPATPPAYPVPPAYTPMPAGEKIKPNFMGILADALSAAAGMQPQYAPELRRRKAEQTALERGEQQYRRRQADDRAEWLWRQQNTPKSPYRWESNDGSLLELGPDGQPRVVYKDPTPKEKWVFDPVRGYININALTPQPRRLDKLPEGAVPLGGQTPPASGNFPRY